MPRFAEYAVRPTGRPRTTTEPRSTRQPRKPRERSARRWPALSLRTRKRRRSRASGPLAPTLDPDGNRTAKFKSTSGGLDSTATDITCYGWDNRNRMTAIKHYADYTGAIGVRPGLSTFIV